MVVAAVIATPWAVRTLLPEAFARVGLEASVTGGTLNPLRGEIALEGLVIGDPDGPALSFRELGVGLAPGALIRGRIKIRHLRMVHVALDMEKLLALRRNLESVQATGQRGPPLELDELTLVDVRLLALGERIGHDVRVHRLHVRDVTALTRGMPSGIALEGSVGDGELTLGLEITLEGEDLRAAGSYRMEGMPAGGWTRLARADLEPVGDGTLNGRGDLRLDYGIETGHLAVILDGRVGVAGLGMALASITARDGRADWQGRLTLAWSPGSTLTLRGDGGLDVEQVHLAHGAGASPSLRATVKDVSWQGEFDTHDGFTARGAVLGTSVQVMDARGQEPAWRIRGDDFSWKLGGRVAGASDERHMEFRDFDLATLLVDAQAHTGPVHVEADKVVFDVLRGVGSGRMALGTASVDTLAVRATAGGEATTFRASGLTARDSSGEPSGDLRVAHLVAASLDYAAATRRVRADDIALADVGLGVPSRIGAGELKTKSVRVEQGEADIWIADLVATRLRGEAGETFGAEAVRVGHMFQSGPAEVSWDATGLDLQRIHGQVGDAGTIGAAHLDRLKVGARAASWTLEGLRASELSATRDGVVSGARVDLESLEHRMPGAGRLRVRELGAQAARVRDARADLDVLKAARLQYDTAGGSGYDVQGLEAWSVTGDRSDGVAANRFSAARGEGRLASGDRLHARAFQVQSLTIGSAGELAAETARLGGFTHEAPDAAALGVEDTLATGLRWKPGGALGAASAGVSAARYSRGDDMHWSLEKLRVGNLAWDGAERVVVSKSALASVSQSRGETQDWISHNLRATDFRFVSPDRLEVAAMAADSVSGVHDAVAWDADSVHAQTLSSSQTDGQVIDELVSGAVRVTDSDNGSAFGLDRAAVKGIALTPSRELSAATLLLANLRLRSTDPAWPSRLTVAELRIAAPSLGLDGVVDLGRVVASSPYLIVAQSKDNQWMWPPLPGAGSGAANSAGAPGVRVASFVTRGAARVAYMDRATDPVFHMVVDPLVVAIQNLDTSLPGNVARFRARGTGSRFSEIAARGGLRTAVHGLDLQIQVDVTGGDLEILNPYVARREPVAVTAGRGDARGAIAIRNDQLTGEVNLLLSGLELQSTVGGKVFEAVDPANLPIRTALALLKDRGGNISLEIPLRVDTAAPAYDFIDSFERDLVRTVTTAGQAAANLPGKTIDGAIRLLERTVSLLPGVDATRYGPIGFSPGADAPGAQALVYLDQLGARMNRHESLSLALCGRAASADEGAVGVPSAGIEALFTEASTGIYATFAPGREGLLALAAVRADVVRRYLRGVHKIPESRLSSCDPEYDESPASSPRVDLVVKTPAGRGGIFGLLP